MHQGTVSPLSLVRPALTTLSQSPAMLEQRGCACRGVRGALADGHQHGGRARGQLLDRRSGDPVREAVAAHGARLLLPLPGARIAANQCPANAGLAGIGQLNTASKEGDLTLIDARRPCLE